MRAAHLLLDRPPWILEDVYARRLLSDRYFSAVEASTAEWPPDVFRALRTHFCVRARLAEDVAIERLDRGCVDYALLGAGADTHAWRHPRAGELTIWEIDHPSQAWKRTALDTATLAIPPNLRLVGVDLEVAALADVALPARATWNWLGVTQYLQKSATESTLRTIAATGAGTGVTVEFLLAEEGCDELGLAFRSRSIDIAEQAGEPMKSFYRPREINALLQRSGLGRIELLDAAALAARYDIESTHLPGAAILAIAST